MLKRPRGEDRHGFDVFFDDKKKHAFIQETVMTSPRNFLLIAAAILSVSAAAGAAPATRPDLYGNPAGPSAAQRSVVISPSIRFVNVKGGETVRFVVNEQAFAWHFNIAANVSAVDLRTIAPPGLIDRKVTVYVSPDLRYYP